MMFIVYIYTSVLHLYSSLDTMAYAKFNNMNIKILRVVPFNVVRFLAL